VIIEQRHHSRSGYDGFALRPTSVSHRWNLLGGQPCPWGGRPRAVAGWHAVADGVQSRPRERFDDRPRA